MTDDYRAKAKYCRQMADQVLSPPDKEMSQVWQSLEARFLA
jgi:hypothetical protein